MVFEVNINSNESFLDELILDTKTLFQEEGIARFLRLILESIDKQACD
jgi:hypothetical protein